MQYSLPQFVDVEDKIIDFPPLTIKQFLTFVVMGILMLLYWYIFSIGAVFFALTFPTLLNGGTLGFAKFNGRPIILSAPNLLRYYLTPKKRVFMRLGESTAVVKKQEAPAVKDTGVPPQPEIGSRLKRLAYLLDEKSAEEERLLRTGAVSQEWLNKI